MAKSEMTPRPCALLLIGGSAGSLDVLLKILPGVKSPIAFSIVIVVHRKKSTESALSDLLGTRSSLPVKEIEDKEMMHAGTIYVAPSDYHLLFEKNRMFALDYSEKVNYCRPSIDVSFDSASEVYGPSLVCLLLSGANSDGAAGLKLAKERGALVAAQNPATADSPCMPEEGIKKAGVERILNPEQITGFINSL